MKITWKHGDRSIEFEHRPMPEGRFRVLCSLMLSVIGGAVLLGLVHMLGVWGLVWPVGALAMFGIYKIIQSI